MKIADVIVVGSGCSGAMAAQTLVESGKDVVMLDGGATNTDFTSRIPDKDFLDIREHDPKQYRYFLGENVEGVTWGKVGKGEQLTPPRKHIFALSDSLMPMHSDSFHPAESLAYGGLGVGWGIGCWEFSDAELQAATLPLKTMRQAYQTVADRIGISATNDDAAGYTLGTLKNYMDSPRLDRNHQRIAAAYQNHKTWFDAAGFTMGRAPLALLTEDKDDRKKYAYRDMDFYSDNDKSAYRPWMTIDQLRTKSNFNYIGGQLVVSFSEQGRGQVEVVCLDIKTQKHTTFAAKRLVLAAGALSSARIVLRSTAKAKTKVPILSNPYSYTPCLQPAFFGKVAEPHKLGFAQMSLFLDEDKDMFDVAMASLYTYQSLMLFRIARQAPLDFDDTRILMQYLHSGMVIMGIHQPDTPSASKYLQLLPDSTSPTGDTLDAHYELSDEERDRRNQREAKYVRAARKLGLYTIKRIDPGFGSSIHYAGTLPFSKTAKPLTLKTNGQLHGTSNVYVADSSSFTYLPAKGLTFSLMANAHLIAKNALS